MNIQGRLINAISAAKLRNGWDVVEIGQKHPGGDGLVPYGVVRFRRPTHGQPDERRFGTAEWVERDDTITFQNGHYDLTEGGSRQDYQQRANAIAYDTGYRNGRRDEALQREAEARTRPCG